MLAPSHLLPQLLSLQASNMRKHLLQEALHTPRCDLLLALALLLLLAARIPAAPRHCPPLVFGLRRGTFSVQAQLVHCGCLKPQHTCVRLQ